MRKTGKELTAICNKLGVNTLWSFSRYDCYKTDTWEYYLKYILHEKEDRTNGIYAVSGGYCHDILEKLYNGEIKYEDMINEYEDSLFNMNLAELKYDRSDSEKNEKIANKYENCIRHFFKNHEMVKFPHKQEEFVLIKIADDLYMQGYIDFLFIEKVEDRKIVHIVDYKTSTKYSGDAIISHGKQLMIYALGISQRLNIPIEDIVCEWNFLKYATVTYEQKNGTKKDRFIERNTIGESLVNTAKMWLKAFGYEDDLDNYIDAMILSNSIDGLPNEVRDKFEIHDCYIQVPLSDDVINDLKNDIIETVKEINEKEREYNNTKDKQIFWQEVTDADAFRIGVLSGYSRSLHLPYDQYMKEKEMFLKKDEEESEDDDLAEFLSNL